MSKPSGFFCLPRRLAFNLILLPDLKPMRVYYVICFWILTVSSAVAEVSIRQTLLLTVEEQRVLRELIRENEEVQKHWYSIQEAAQIILNEQPQPLKVIYYEGLLDTDPKRVKTEQSLRDMDKLAVLLNAFYGTQDKMYAEKAKIYIMGWINTYEASGNPVNENKFEPLLHTYHIMKDHFTSAEQTQVAQWMVQIAEAEMGNPNIPENNWKAKQIKLVGTIGLILQKQSYINYAIKNFKAYVDKVLYADGTSRDLHQRDALSYHISSLDPLLTFAITLEQIGKNNALDLFRYESPEGGSVKKSLDYVIPYATGEKEYKEWVNTTVELDRRRAEAGLENYQPGKLFDPTKSKETFELAYYFDPAYKAIIQDLSEKSFRGYSTWLMVVVDVLRQS